MKILYPKILTEYREAKHSRGTEYIPDHYVIDYQVILSNGNNLLGRIEVKYTDVLDFKEIGECIKADMSDLMKPTLNVER